MMLIGAHRISKSFTARALFENLTFSIENRERIGLIGPNGAGKSTLLKILSGQVSVDSGQLTLAKGLRIGFLEQVPQFLPEATLLATIMEGAQDPYDWESMALAQELCSRLELKQWGEEKPVNQLSGGWKKRVALARELLKQPDLLLLDEPTNHLDVQSILWLEELLSEAKFATVTITHDRLFLQKISNRIIEIDRRHADGLLSVRGSYADFLESREKLLLAQQNQEQKLRNTLKREMEWLRRGAKARQTKQQARMEATQDLAQTVENISAKNRNSQVRFDFQSAERNPKKLIEAENITKSYEGQLIIPEVNLLIGPKSRVGLMGVNGCGKSTLIRLLTKEVKPDTGTVFHAEKLEVSYFEQNRESLDPELSVLKTICPTGDHVDYAGTLIHARSYLSRFLFSQEQMDTPVRKLSGGEQSRLLLARVMLTKANLLILDEPTNDLDMATLDMLATVLQDFNGAILLVTHDRYFLDQITHQILAFGFDKKGHKTIESMVGLEQWQEWHDQQLLWREHREKVREAPSIRKIVQIPQLVNEKVDERLKKELSSIESKIEKAEEKLKNIQQKVENLPTKDAEKLTELTIAMGKVQSEVDELYNRWTEVHSLLEV